MSLPAAFCELFLEDVPIYVRRAAVWVGARIEALSAFAIKRALILIFVAGVLLLAVIAFFMAAAGHNPIDVGHWLGEEPTAEDLRNYFWAIGLPLGAVIVLITLVNALRRTRALEQQASTDSARVSLAEREFDASTLARRDEFNAGTFAKALELLGSDSVIKRIGAVYALEDLMRAAFAVDGDRTQIGRQIGDTLAAYVRRRAIGREEIEEAAIETFPEISSALTAIIRSWPPENRPQIFEDGGVDLRGADLAGWEIPKGSNLSRIRFDGARLTRFKAYRLEASDASFANCDLSHSVFDFSQLADCDFTEANFYNSRFLSTNIYDCMLNDVNFTEAEFISTKIHGSDWGGAVLTNSMMFSGSITETDASWPPPISEEQVRSVEFSTSRPTSLPSRLAHLAKIKARET